MCVFFSSKEWSGGLKEEQEIKKKKRHNWGYHQSYFILVLFTSLLFSFFLFLLFCNTFCLSSALSVQTRLHCLRAFLISYFLIFLGEA